MLFLNRRYTDGVTLPRKGLDAILGTSQSLLKEEAQVGITRQIAITHKVDNTFTVQGQGIIEIRPTSPKFLGRSLTLVSGFWLCPQAET